MEILKGTWYETKNEIATENGRVNKNSINMAIIETNVYGRHTDDLTFSLCISFACVHKCLCLNNFMIDSIIPCYGCEWKIHFLTFKTPGQKLQKKASVFISNIPSLLTHIPLSYNWKKSIILWSLSEFLLTAFFPETRLRNFKVVLDYFVHGFLILSSKEH